MKLTGTARIGTNGDQIMQEASRLAATKPGFILVIADTALVAWPSRSSSSEMPA